jgi:predicted secreted protein
MLIEDKRSKKVAFVAHCLLNQSAKVNGYAFFPAMVDEVIDLFRKHDYGIVQLPCPEMLYAGVKRWWYVADQYNTPGFIDLSRNMLRPIVNQIKEYINNGYKVVIIGLDGSPSCGLNWTVSDPSWGGKPEITFEADPIVPGQGVFMKILLDLIKEEGLPEIPSIGAGFDMLDFKLEKVVEDLNHFLDNI